MSGVRASDSAPSGAAPGAIESSLLFIGTATVLIRHGGFTILTDPNFLHRGQYAYLGYGLVSRRLLEPTRQVADLPPLDAVVLSHMHGDHFDRVAAAGLDHDLPVVTTPAAARRLHRRGFRRARGLATWQTQELRREAATVRITALPGHHGRGAMDAILPPVMGSLLEFSAVGGHPGLRIYITGDTLVHEDLRTIAERHPGIDLAVLHLGGTRILGLVLVTMDGRQGVDLLEMLEPANAVPIHYGDYGVFRSPLAEFDREVTARRPSTRVRRLARGRVVPLSELIGDAPG